MLAAAKEARHDGAPGDGQGLGNGVVAHVFQCHQQDHRPLLLRQAVEGCRQVGQFQGVALGGPGTRFRDSLVQ